MSIPNEMPKEEMLLDIKELLRSVEKLKVRAERAERERDAAIRDIEEVLIRCDTRDVCFACARQEGCSPWADGCQPRWRRIVEGE